MPSRGTAVREGFRAVVVVVALMSLAIPTPRVHAQDTTEASSLQKEVEELRREVKSLQEQVKTLKTEPVTCSAAAGSARAPACNPR